MPASEGTFFADFEDVLHRPEIVVHLLLRILAKEARHYGYADVSAAAD
jgi:hypothetical protein